MRSCGKNVRIHPNTSVFFGLNNLTIGNDVSIPRYAHIFCNDAPLTIGNKVVFGPAPTIVTGNHRIDVVGKFIVDSHEKLFENDKEVIIEDDIWVGANVTILMGVTVGRGCVIAAGSVVNKSCPPYSIIGGVPAKILKYRFNIDEIIKHEMLLYPSEKRYRKKDIEKFIVKYE
ncbi:MAG: acyltransferase [Bacteroidia bacterium]